MALSATSETTSRAPDGLARRLSGEIGGEVLFDRASRGRDGGGRVRGGGRDGGEQEQERRSQATHVRGATLLLLIAAAQLTIEKCQLSIVNCVAGSRQG